VDFDYSDKVKGLQARVSAFMDEHIYPNQKTYWDQLNGAKDRWQPIRIIEDLKPKAKAAGLWNLFLPESHRGAGLTNLEYAPLCEIMGRVHWASEIFNCSMIRVATQALPRRRFSSTSAANTGSAG
jgi:acyl-CoA dehydrogenase